MDKIVPSNEYEQGQMMGMLVVIQMLENAREQNVPIMHSTLDKIKRIAVKSLSEYLEKPEEDVILLVNEQLGSI